MDNRQPNQTIEFRSPLVRREPDDEIAKRALSLLRWKIRYNAIRVNAEKGHVTLSGEVSWDFDREAAEHAVRRLSGVVGITNLIYHQALRRPSSQKPVTATSSRWNAECRSPSDSRMKVLNFTGVPAWHEANSSITKREQPPMPESSASAGDANPHGTWLSRHV
jgi:BON domain